MRKTLLSAAAVLSAALTLGALSSSAHASSGGYVALGDSYSSGDGAGNYYSDSGSCLRSPNAYPALWAAAHSPSSFNFVACAGAKVPDVESSQLSAVTSATSLISITIGGNDIGFSSVMQTCVLGSDSDCENAVTAAENQARTSLAPALSGLFSQIRGRAPSAHVDVLDYPHLYDLSAWFCIGLDSTKHQVLNQGADVLDGVISTATSNAGFTFADVRSQFSGHELCSGDGWLHSVTYPIDESYHPTATGQADGYLPVFSLHT
jgi:hypothetical protein